MAEETKTKNVGMGVLCYLGILVLIPLLTEAKDDPFVKFHIKQGLVLLIFAVIINVVLVIPVLGWIIGAVGWIITVYLMIVGIINVVNGEEKQLPILGQYGENFKI